MDKSLFFPLAAPPQWIISWQFFKSSLSLGEEGSVLLWQAFLKTNMYSFDLLIFWNSQHSWLSCVHLDGHMARWVYSLPYSLNISFPTVGREELCGFPPWLLARSHAMSVLPPGSRVFLYIWPNLYPSDCSIFGIGLEAAERSLFFICSKYLSVNVNGKTKGRDWYGLQSCTY